jgi:hypothetical protein
MRQPLKPIPASFVPSHNRLQSERGLKGLTSYGPASQARSLTREEVAKRERDLQLAIIARRLMAREAR